MCLPPCSLSNIKDIITTCSTQQDLLRFSLRLTAMSDSLFAAFTIGASMESRLAMYMAAQANLSEEENVFGLCGVIGLLTVLGFSMDDLTAAWKEEYNASKNDFEDEGESIFDPNTFNAGDPWGFARAVVDNGHAARVRPPLSEAVCRQVRDLDEIRLYQIFHDFSVGTTQVYTF